MDDSDEFRYATMRDPDSEGELAGIMDARAFLPDGVPAQWSIYWEVSDACVATALDPAGAQFKLPTTNR